MIARYQLYLLILSCVWLKLSIVEGSVRAPGPGLNAKPWLIPLSSVLIAERFQLNTPAEQGLPGCVSGAAVGPRALQVVMEDDSVSFFFVHRDKIGDSALVLCFSRKRRNRILLPTLNQHFGLDLDSEWHRNQIIDKEETFLLPCRAGNGFLVLGFLFWVCGRHHFLFLFSFFSLRPYI